MIINHNLSAINAQRSLGMNLASVQRNSEKLASGLRIVRAADDAAGLAVSERMRTQVRGLAVASRNIQDAVSLIQTTEGYLNETTAILQRMRELTVQAANGIYNDGDLQQIQYELNQLTSEVDRIAIAADFNKLKVISGDFGAAEGGAAESNPIQIQVGWDVGQNIKMNIDGMTAVALGLAEAGGAADATRGEREINSKINVVPAEGGAAGDLSPAENSIALITSAIDTVVKQRANLGAYQNRMEAAMRGVNYSIENLQAAESRIRDADMADFMVNYVKDNILSQTSMSMLAQANMNPQLVLRLLG